MMSWYYAGKVPIRRALVSCLHTRREYIPVGPDAASMPHTV